MKNLNLINKLLCIFSVFIDAKMTKEEVLKAVLKTLDLGERLNC